MKIKIKHIFASLLILITLFSCGTNHDPSTDNEFEYLYMMYLGGDNNLDESLSEDFDELITGFNNFANNKDRTSIVALILFDSNKENTEFYEIKFPVSGKTEISDKTSFIKGNINTADSEILKQCLEFAKTNYRYKKSILSVGSHGSGIFGTPVTSSSYKSSDSLELSRLLIEDEIEGDKTIYSWMSEPDFAKAIEDAGFKDEDKLGILHLDLCTEGSVEVAYELRNCCEYFIGSQENIPGDGFDYISLISTLTHNKSIENIACEMVNIFSKKGYTNSRGYDTLAVFNSSNLFEIIEPVNELSNYLINDSNFSTYSSYITDTLFYYNFSNGKDFIDNIPAKMTFAYSYDLGFFAQKLKIYAETLSDTTLSELCDNVINACEDIILYSWANKTYKVLDSLYPTLNDEGRNYYGVAITGNANKIKDDPTTVYPYITYKSSGLYHPYYLSDFSFKKATTWGNLLEKLYPSQFTD